MQSTSLAPSCRPPGVGISCWIIGHAPGLRRAASASAWTAGGSRPRGPGRRPWRVVLAVVGVEPLGPLHGLAVAGVADPLDHGHDHGRLHGVGHHQALADLAAVGPLFGRCVGTSARRPSGLLLVVVVGVVVGHGAPSPVVRRHRLPRRPPRPARLGGCLGRPRRLGLAAARRSEAVVVSRPSASSSSRRRAAAWWAGSWLEGQALGLGDLPVRSSVIIRATSLRTWLMREKLSSWPVASWNRRLNSSRRVSASWRSSSSVSYSEISAAVAIRPAPPASRGCRDGSRSGP